MTTFLENLVQQFNVQPTYLHNYEHTYIIFIIILLYYNVQKLFCYWMQLGLEITN